MSDVDGILFLFRGMTSVGPLIEKGLRNAWPCSNKSICDIDLFVIC